MTRARMSVFLAGTMGVFLLLLAPLPRVKAAHASWVRVLGNSVLSPLIPGYTLEFEPSADDTDRLDSTATVSRDGRLERWQTSFNSRSVGSYVCVALFLALSIAGPRPRRRRWLRFSIGLVLVHLYVLVRASAAVLMSLTVHVQRHCWDASSHSEFLSSSRWREGLSMFNEMQLNPGVELLVALCIWIVVKFDKSDGKRLFGDRPGSTEQSLAER